MDINKLTMEITISACKLIWDLESKLVTFSYKLNGILNNAIIGIMI